MKCRRKDFRIKITNPNHWRSGSNKEILNALFAVQPPVKNFFINQIIIKKPA